MKKDVSNQELMDSEIGYSFDVPLNTLFENTAEEKGGSTAVTGPGGSFTYRELNGKANQLARHVRNLFTRQEEIVAVMLSRTVLIFPAILAILKAGGAYLPVDSGLPVDRIKYMLDDSTCTMILTDRSCDPKIKEMNVSQKVLYIDNDSLYTGNEENITNKNEPGDLAYIRYTSGSTGMPKGVMIEHRSVVNLLLGLRSCIDLPDNPRILSCTSISFDLFEIDCLFSLVHGIEIVMADEEAQKNPRQLYKLINGNDVTIIQTTPSQMQLLLLSPQAGRHLEGVRLFLLCGETFPQPLLEKMQQTVRGKIYNLYGPTETAIYATIKDLTDADVVTIGKPLPHYRVFVMDEEKNVAPDGEEGELCIGGVCLARGYINKKELTAVKFVQSKYGTVYKTGDKARRNIHGELDFLGRMDSQVKIRGFRVEPEEIEKRVLHYPGIRGAAVLVKQRTELDKFICVFFVGAEHTKPGDIMEYCSKTLPYYMVPEKIVKLKEMPLTPSRKIDRVALAAYGEPEEEPSPGPAADSITEKIIGLVKTKMKSLKPKDTIDLDANLKDVGINSIIFVELIVEIEAGYGVEFDDDAFTMNNFRNIKSIIDYVIRKKSVS